MGSFSGGLETIGIEFDPRSILAGVALANKQIEGLEGATEKTASGMKRDWESVASLLTRVADRSKNASDSYIRSLERQAAAVGKSGMDKLNSQMEQAIKNYGYSEAAINKITAAYDKLRTAQSKHEESGGGFGAGTRAGMGARDLFEGRNAYAAVEFGKGLSELQGAPAILGAVSAGFLAAAAAGFELVKSTAEEARELNNLAIRTGLSVEQAENLSIQAKIAGVDISSLERSAIQLSKGLEDASGAGKKQIEVLRDMGISTLQASGQQKEMGQVLLEVLQHLSQIPDTSKRLYESQLLLGRGAKELQPMIANLATLKETADKLSQSLDQGANEQLLKASDRINEMGEAWKIFKKNLSARIAPIIIPVLYSFTKDQGNGPKGLATDSTALSGALDLYRNGSFAPAPGTALALATGIASQSGGGEATRQRILRQQGTTQEGLESTLTDLKKQIADDRAILNQKGADSQKYIDTNKDLNKARSEQLATENALKALRSGKDNSVDKYLTGVHQSFAAQQVSPLQKMLEERDTKLRDFQDQFSYLPEAQMKTGLDQIAKDASEAFDRVLSEMSLKSKLASQKIAEDQRKELLKDQELGLPTFPKFSGTGQVFPGVYPGDQGGYIGSAAEDLKSNKEALRRAAEYSKAGLYPFESASVRVPGAAGPPPGPDARQQAELTKDMLAQESRRIELLSGPGGELAAAHQILDLKKQSLAIDEGLAEQEAQSITNQLDRDRKIFDIRLEYSRQVYDAESQYQDKLLEQQKQVAETAAGLYHTLFTNPKQFGPQLASTLKEAALKPVDQALGNLTARALAPVLGGLSGGLSDIRATNGALHVFVTNPVPDGGSTDTSSVSIPYFGSGGTSSLPYFGASGPLFNSGTSGGGGFSLPSLFSGGNPASMLGPGGTSGFTGPVGGGFNLGSHFGGGGLFSIGGSGGGFNLGSLFGRGPNPGPSASSQPGWTGGAAPPPGGYDADAGMSAKSVGSLGGGLASAAASAGTTFGPLIAMHGLTGKDAGTAAGIGWGTLGGAATGAGIGFDLGGPLGAALGAGIGAAAGALAGIGEMLAGVESPQTEAKRLVKQMYGITINDQAQNQIVKIAQQNYAGRVSLAVRSPEVRQMLGLYAQGTGQSSAKAIMNSMPHGAGLSESGGTLYQDTSTLFGASYKYASSLPTLGGNNSTQQFNSPAPPPIVIQSLTLPIGDKSVAAFLTGSVVTSDYVSDQFTEGLANSYNRVQNSATLQEPGLITS